jgi:hypothetical protein
VKHGVITAVGRYYILFIDFEGDEKPILKTKINKIEVMKKIKKLDPVIFPIDKLTETICKEYSINPEEFNSSFKYQPLPEARQLYCLTLQRLGAKNRDICKISGFTPARVTLSIIAGTKLLKSTPYFLNRFNSLINLFK